MKPVTFSRVKQRAVQQACVTLDDILSNSRCAYYAMLEGVADGTFDWRKNHQKLQEIVCERIKKWDIRCLKRLHMLFPNCLPKDCKYIVEQSEHEWWIVA